MLLLYIVQEIIILMKIAYFCKICFKYQLMNLR
jgi:hypothetical protein